MQTTGIAELKASLSETLARVKAGEEVLVTEHGRPIARIVPLSPASPEAVAGADPELIRSGLLLPPKKPGGVGEDFFKLPRGEDPEGLVLAALLEERRSGR
jgi:prevent-host-death family protein